MRTQEADLEVSDITETDDQMSLTVEETELDIQEHIAVPEQPALDLDELLTESLALQARGKQHRENLRRLRGGKNNALDQEEQKKLLAKVLEWESLRVWRTTARIHKFNVITCQRCLRQHTIYDGEWLEQEHDRLHARRLVRLPDRGNLQLHADMLLVAVEQLPENRVEVVLEQPTCRECCAVGAPGFRTKISF
jgi:hypothetical protein